MTAIMEVAQIRAVRWALSLAQGECHRMRHGLAARDGRMRLYHHPREITATRHKLRGATGIRYHCGTRMVTYMYYVYQ